MRLTLLALVSISAALATSAGCHFFGKKVSHSRAANQYMHRRPLAELIRDFDDPARAAWQKPEAVIRVLDPQPGQKIADLGAGSGYFSFRLAREFPATQIVALEPEAGFRAHLDTVNADRKSPNLEIRAASYTDSGLRAAEADAILTVNVYHHIQNRVEYLRTLKSRLKPGGKLVVVDFKDGRLPVGPPVEHKVPTATLRAELESAGFAVSADETTLPHQVIWVAR